jgi:hypothetical protein
VAFLLLALIAVLAVWGLTSHGGGGGKGSASHGPGGRSPAASITPGPSPTGTGPLVTTAPGGRDSDSGGGSDAGSGSGGSSSAGSAGSSGSGSSGSGSSGNAGSGGSGSDADDPNGGSSGSGSGSSGSGSGSGAAGSGSGGGTTPGRAVSAGSSLPVCGPSAVSLSLRSAHNTYQPGEKPRLRLTATNHSAHACRINVGPTATVFTLSTQGDSHVWSSKDCPASRAARWLEVPAHDSTTYALDWNRRTSKARCTSSQAGHAAGDGTYLVVAKASGFGSRTTSFNLADD